MGAEVLDDLDREYAVLSEQRGRAIAWAWYLAQLLHPATWWLAWTLWRVVKEGEPRRPFRLGERSRSFAFPWLDLKLGLRMLGKHPGLTIVAVFALAVGIPAGLAPTHVGRVQGAPIPVPDGDRVRVLRYVDLETGRPQSPFIDDFARWREQLTSFSSVAFASIRRQYNLITDDGRAAPVQGAAVTPSFFDTLRTPPLLGRALASADDVPGAPSVVVISYELWQSSFDGDPGVVGRTARVGGARREVVGIMPKGFHFPYRDQLWLPLQGNVGAGEALPYRGAGWLVFGRLMDGVSPEAAEAEFTAVRDRWVLELPNLYARLRPQIVPFTIGLYAHPRLGALVEPRFVALQALALLALVATCANVGMLIFARTAARAPELAVRTALGATRPRIVAQLFLESLVIAGLAAGVGLFIADRAVAILLPRFLQNEPLWLDYGLTLESVFLAIAFATGSAVIAGTGPALRITGPAVRKSIEGAGERSALRFGGLSGALVVANVALAVATVGAGVFLGLGLIGVEGGPGEFPQELLTAELTIPDNAVLDGPGPFDVQVYTSHVVRIRRELVERLEAEPGVRGVALADALPDARRETRWIELDGEAPTQLPTRHRVQTAQVHPGFFETLDRSPILGRGFSETDIEQGGPAVVVSTTLVERLMNGRNPLGRRLRYTNPNGEPGPWREIVGVVEDMAIDSRVQRGIAQFDRVNGEVYHVLAGPDRVLSLAVNFDRNREQLASRLRALVAEIDPSFIVSEPRTLAEAVDSSRRQTVALMGGTAFLTMFLVALAASGLYALMSFTVTQRRRELAIRAALGARRSVIMRSVARRSVTQLASGSVLGGLIVWWTLQEAEGLTAMWSGGSVVSLALLVSIGVLILVGALACTRPVLRAMKITPSEALK